MRGGGDLDARPLRDWVEREIAEHGEAAAAEIIGPDLHRQVRRLRFEGQATVTSNLADRLLDRFGLGLWELYPEEEAAGIEAWCPDCDEVVMTAASGHCLWCNAQTGGTLGEQPTPLRSVPTKMRLETLYEARRLYLAGDSLTEAATQLWRETDHKDAEAMGQALRRAFRSRGWPTRGRRGPGSRTRSWDRWRETVEVARRASMREFVPLEPMQAWLTHRVAAYPSAEEFARSLGVSVTTVRKYLHGIEYSQGRRRRKEWADPKAIRRILDRDGTTTFEDLYETEEAIAA